MNGHDEPSSKVVILDAGAQYAKVIDRRCRELKVESHLLPLGTPSTSLLQQGFRAIIISGGPGSVNDADAPAFDPAIFSCGLPVLGICYGFHAICQSFGGVVTRDSRRHDGPVSIEVDADSPLFEGLQRRQDVLLTHGDCASRLPEDFQRIAGTDGLVLGISRDKVYGVQFHPEVDLTPHGRAMLSNFLFKIAPCMPTFTLENRELTCTRYIQETVGDRTVIMLLSGGVDSTVASALLSKALPSNRIVAIHIDHGFMREDESNQVEKSLSDLGLNIRVIHADKIFMNSSTDLNEEQTSQPLHCITDPEIKRKIIGDTFARVIDKYVEETLRLDKNDVILGQGTLRPDLIESASSLVSSHANKIKTHHNDTSLIRMLRSENRVVEPLRDFHKDEVRALGRQLGLPSVIVERHPFPGPGLAIRILCAEEPFKDEEYYRSRALLDIIVRFHDLRKHVSHVILAERASGTIQSALSGEQTQRLDSITAAHQLKAVLLPIRSVGVQGDQRTYSYVAALALAESSASPDGAGGGDSSMTDDGQSISAGRAGVIPWQALSELAPLITRICHKINRVVFVFDGFTDVVHDEMGELITVTRLSDETIGKARVADANAMRALRDGGCLAKIAQMPVILLPVQFCPLESTMEASLRHSIVLRPFITRDFMTGLAALPGKDLPEEVVLDMAYQIRLHTSGISRVMYDLTNKPPGTTEWE